MGKVHATLNDRLREFISAQPLYFVATAPDEGGHVNVSPKGHADTFAIIDDLTVAYLDLTGSGVETIAHLRQNSRITIMFCAFEGPPNIVRLYGTGRVVTPQDAEFEELLKHFDPRRGARAIVVVDCDRISDSCGFAVPFMAYERERPLLEQWTEGKDEQQLLAYRAKKNTRSIDGLPGL